MVIMKRILFKNYTDMNSAYFLLIAEGYKPSTSTNKGKGYFELKESRLCIDVKLQYARDFMEIIMGIEFDVETREIAEPHKGLWY